MKLTIPANDHGQIRVFAHPGPLPEGDVDDIIAGWFGTTMLDATYVDIVRISDLGPMKLTDYIAQGYDMVAADEDVAAVNGISGYAILILSRAAQEQEVVLTPVPDMRHVTTYLPDAQLTPIVPLSADSAKGIIGDPPAKPPKSDARIGGMVATVALIVMFLLVGLMIWVGG